MARPSLAAWLIAGWLISVAALLVVLTLQQEDLNDAQDRAEKESELFWRAMDRAEKLNESLESCRWALENSR